MTARVTAREPGAVGRGEPRCSLSPAREGAGGSPGLAPPLGLFPRGPGVRVSFWGGVEIEGLGGALSSGGRVPAAPGGRAEEPRSWLLHVWLLDAEAAAAAASKSSSSSGGARMLGQQQQLYSSAALLTGERSRLLTCYVQDYLECVESLPHDMQRNVSVLRELDNKYQGTFSFSADSVGEVQRAIWCCGTGKREVRGRLQTGLAALPVLTAAARDFQEPPVSLRCCSPGGWLQLPRTGISHFKRAFVRVPASCAAARLSCPGLASVQWGAGWAGCWAYWPLSAGPPPSASRCIGTCGGREREDGEGGLG